MTIGSSVRPGRSLHFRGNGSWDKIWIETRPFSTRRIPFFGGSERGDVTSFLSCQGEDRELRFPPRRCNRCANKRQGFLAWFGAEGGLETEKAFFFVRSFTRTRQLKSGKKNNTHTTATTFGGKNQTTFRVGSFEGEFHHHSNVNGDYISGL